MKAVTNEIKSLIESAYDNGISSFGLRRMTGGVIASVGDDVADSFVWDDGIMTDESLGGVSSIGFDVDFGEVDEDSFVIALGLMSRYDGQLVIIGGRHNIDAVHIDHRERVLSNAVVIAVLD